MKIAAAAAIAVFWIASAAHAAPNSVGDCHVGGYRFGDGSVMAVGPNDADLTLRWRKFDGTTGKLTPKPGGGYTSTLGWTDRPDGHTVIFSDCAEGKVSFDGAVGRRIDFEVAETTFRSGDVTLAGRLVMPKGSSPVPVVVLLHGSENYSGRDIYPHQWLLPAEGVGVFVYDKRGTGRSTGHYTQDFDVLANDAVAALAEAREVAGARAARVGYMGGSQGGWVAPLAASRTRADFVIVGFGLLVDPIEEDREEMALEMKLAGRTPEETARALEIADAAAEVVTSKLKSGLDRFDAVRAKYKNEPWYKDVHGNFTGDLLPYDRQQLLAHRDELLVGTSWRYDGMAVQKTLHTPELWELGTDDLAAPSAETARRLKTLIAEGHPITIAMFPRSQHGIYQYELKPDGTRVNTRNAAGYFAAMRDFALCGRLKGPYGEAEITQPEASAR
jgi:pimeloyl-ACP methyl ester carboxylesterase